MVSLIEASPFDAGTAYAAVDAHKLDNFKPYIFKTSRLRQNVDKNHDWLARQLLRSRRARRSQAQRLLYAGTETGIWVSFDDGAHWQTLQLEFAHHAQSTI